MPQDIIRKSREAYVKACAEHENNNRKGISRPRPRWFPMLVEPLVAALQKDFPEIRIEGTGPFGLASNIGIRAYPLDDTTDRSIGGIQLRLGNLNRGELEFIDYETNTNKYAPRSIGYWNGMNHPGLPVNSYDEVAERFRANLPTATIEPPQPLHDQPSA